MVNIQVTEVHVLPKHYQQSGDMTLYDNEEADVIARITNEGGHTGQFKVMVKVDGQNVHDEWIHDLTGSSEDWMYVPLMHVKAGEHNLMVIADATSRVTETEEYFDNVVEQTFTVHYRQVNADEHKVDVHVTEKQWEQAGWKRVTVNVQVWDFLNNPLADFDVFLMVDGTDTWLNPEHQMQHGAARFTKVLVHPSGALHIGCKSRSGAAVPYLSGVFTAAINTDNAVVIDAWQDTDIETWTDSDLHTHTSQWSVSAKTSVKGGFKILGAGGEASVEVGGTYGQSDSDATGRSKAHRVLIAKPDLVAQKPQRGV